MSNFSVTTAFTQGVKVGAPLHSKIFRALQVLMWKSRVKILFHAQYLCVPLRTCPEGKFNKQICSVIIVYRKLFLRQTVFLFIPDLTTSRISSIT